MAAGNIGGGWRGLSQPARGVASQRPWLQQSGPGQRLGRKMTAWLILI